jgi:lysyl-tRNA synthetase class 2
MSNLNPDAAKASVDSTMSLDRLRARAAWVRQLREFFWNRGFVEVETPVLSRDTVIDRHIDPIALRLSGNSVPYFLQTSPEYLMKRLLRLGEPAIFQIAHAFREGESGSQHNPEFTLCEWYRVGDDYQAGQDFLADLAQELLDVPGVERLTYRQAFQRWADIDPFSDSTKQIVEYAKRAAGDGDETFSRELGLDILFTEFIQPHLGIDAPTLLVDYPADQAALAQVTKRAYGWVAERFELFWKGLELANGYHELLDPRELKDRQHRINQERVSDGKTALPEQSRLLDAMNLGLPPCSGVALGVERTLQALLGLETIAEVMTFPIDRA